MKSSRAVLFDLDGTLIDSIELIVDSYHHTFSTHGLPVVEREAIIEGIGTPLRTVFGAMTNDAASIDQWIATYREFNLLHHDTRVRAFPGAVEMVQRISAAGRQLALVTSKNHAGARRGLELVGLGDAFEAVVGADDVTRPKPDAEPVLRALELLGRSPDEVVFIGDSHHDIASGRAAGVKTIAVCWGPFDRDHLGGCGPDYICASPEEVLQQLGL